jgi:hypothetical protein
MAVYDKTGKEVFSDEELEFMTTDLIKFTAQSETGGF